MTRIVFIGELRGRRTVVSLLKLFVVENSVKYLFLLGNTIAPSTIHDLLSVEGLIVKGVTGNYDDASIATTLKKIDGLIEAKFVDTGFFTVYGIGYNVRQAVDQATGRDEKVDMIISFFPGNKYSCTNPGLELVDKVVEHLKPRLILYGRCEKPCIKDNIVCPGPGYKGYLAHVDTTDYKPRLINLYELYLNP